MTNSKDMAKQPIACYMYQLPITHFSRQPPRQLLEPSGLEDHDDRYTPPNDRLATQ